MEAWFSVFTYVQYVCASDWPLVGPLLVLTGKWLHGWMTLHCLTHYMWEMESEKKRNGLGWKRHRKRELSFFLLDLRIQRKTICNMYIFNLIIHLNYHIGLGYCSRRNCVFVYLPEKSSRFDRYCKDVTWIILLGFEKKKKSKQTLPLVLWPCAIITEGVFLLFNISTQSLHIMTGV